MAKESSFDIVSTVDMQELDNAFQQAKPLRASTTRQSAASATARRVRALRSRAARETMKQGSRFKTQVGCGRAGGGAGSGVDVIPAPIADRPAA